METHSKEGTLIAKIEYSVLKSSRSGVKSRVRTDYLKSSRKGLIQACQLRLNCHFKNFFYLKLDYLAQFKNL